VVPYSGDLTSALLLAGSAAVLTVVGPGLAAGARTLMAVLLDGRGRSLNSAHLAAIPAGALSPLLVSLGWLLLAVVVVAVLANVVQVGVQFSTQRVRADFGRLSFAAGLRRMLSRRSWVRAAITPAKIAAVAIVGWITIRSALPKLARLPDLPVDAIAAQAGAWVGRLVVPLAVVLLALAAADYLYQRWQHEQDLKATRREAREELRQSEGDPQVRARRRRLAADKTKAASNHDAPDSRP